MREIKFRAWYKKDGEMRIPLKIWDIHLLAGRREDYILMQYTGLTDKNGKETYQDDIVKYDEPSQFHSGKGVIKYQVDDGAWYIYWYYHKRHIFNAKMAKQLEVIGNIHLISLFV